MALFPAVGRKQPALRISWWLVVCVLGFGIFMHLVPFYFLIVTSLKTGAETLLSPPTFWPHQITFDAWKVAFIVLNGDQTGIGDTNTTVTLIQFFWNSLFMAGMVMLISTPLTALSAYASSKLLRGPMARWIFLFFIGTMLVPGVISQVPLFLMVNHFPFATTNIPKLPTGDDFPSISLFDTPWAIIIPALFNVVGYFYFKAFFDTLPDSILQAARVDGGSEFNIFRRIVLPMSIPVFAIVIPAQFGAIWDGYYWPSLVLSSQTNWPLSVAINTIVNQFNAIGTTNPNNIANTHVSQAMKLGLSWNAVMVLGIIQTVPTFLFFLLSFRYLLSGIRIRGLR